MHDLCTVHGTVHGTVHAWRTPTHAWHTPWRMQVQQLADREASRWVEEMAATRARDAALSSDELTEWVAKSKRLQAR